MWPVRWGLLLAVVLLITGCRTTNSASSLYWLRGQSVLVVAESEGSSEALADGSATGLSRAIALLPFRSWPAEVEASLRSLLVSARGPTAQLREAAEKRRIPWLLVRDEDGLRIETTRHGKVLWRLTLPARRPIRAAVRGLRQAMRPPRGVAPVASSPLLDVDDTRLAEAAVLGRLRELALGTGRLEHREAALDAAGRWPADPAIRTHAALAAAPASPLLSDLQVAVQLNPEGESELFALTLAAEQRGRPSLALGWRKLLAELFPERLDYLPELADLLADHDQAELGLRMLLAGLARGDGAVMKSLPSGTTPHESPKALPYADLSFTVGWYLALAEDWELAAHNYLDAEALYGSLGRPRERSDALNNAGVAMVEAGRPLAAATSLRSAVELRSQQASPDRAATSSYNLARALADADRLGRALRAYEEAAQSYRQAGLEIEAIETQIERLALLARDGQSPAFERAGAELLLLLEQPGQPQELEALASLWFEIGRGRDSMGFREKALSAYRQSLALWRQLSRRLEEAQVLYSMALPHVALLRFSEAHQSLVEALVIAVELGDSVSILAIRSQVKELDELLRARGDEIPKIPEDLRQWLEPERGSGP